MENVNGLQQSTSLMDAVLQKAWSDSSFKQQLVENPVMAIQEAMGQTITLPENQKLIIVDQSSDSVLYFNIPRDPNSVQLTEEQLEAVAGGADIPYVSTSDLVHDLFCNATIWVRNQLN